MNIKKNLESIVKQLSQHYTKIVGASISAFTFYFIQSVENTHSPLPLYAKLSAPLLEGWLAYYVLEHYKHFRIYKKKFGKTLIKFSKAPLRVYEGNSLLRIINDGYDSMLKFYIKNSGKLAMMLSIPYSYGVYRVLSPMSLWSEPVSEWPVRNYTFAAGVLLPFIIFLPFLYTVPPSILSCLRPRSFSATLLELSSRLISFSSPFFKPSRYLTLSINRLRARKYPSPDAFWALSHAFAKIGIKDHTLMELYKAHDSLRNLTDDLVMHSMLNHPLVRGDFTNKIAINEKKLAKNPNDFLSVVNLIYHYQLLGEYSRVVSVLEQYVSNINEFELEGRSLLASILERSGLKEEAAEELDKVTELFLASEKSERKEGRNVKITLKSEQFNTIIFGKGNANPEALYRQFLTTLLVKNSLAEKFSTQAYMHDFGHIEFPIGFAQDEKMAYFISFRRPYSSISELALHNKKQLHNALIHAVNSLAVIQGTTAGAFKKTNDAYTASIRRGKEEKELHLTNFDFESTLRRRFADRMGSSDYGKEFAALMKDFIENRNPGNLELLLHGDFYDTNVLSDGTIIDFEQSAIDYPVYDVAHMLGKPQYRSFANELLTRYIKDLSDNSSFQLNPQELAQSYPAFQLFTDVCQIGSQLNQGNFEMANAYLYFAAHSLKQENERLFKSFAETIKQSQHAPLKESLETLV